MQLRSAAVELCSSAVRICSRPKRFFSAAVEISSARNESVSAPVRIRYYGLLANRHREGNLKRCRELLAGQARAELPATASPGEGWQERLTRLTGRDPTLCPECGQGRLRRIEDLAPVAPNPLSRSPP